MPFGDATLFFACQKSLVQVQNVDILVHIQPVGTAISVDIVTAVVHGTADQRVMFPPMGADQSQVLFSGFIV